jgi:hypothetical protein
MLVKHATILDVLNNEPPGPERGGSIAKTPINEDHLLGIVHVVNLICWTSNPRGSKMSQLII